ncbi:hypothetical protein B0H14DRAFT_3441774 [Mycena olivaceomarginata]|nr:hypothetical protein B0H14DRAFT_3441774 [Mycena olivaceomarginata]
MAPGTRAQKRSLDEDEPDLDLDIQKMVDSIPGVHLYFRTAAPLQSKPKKSAPPKKSASKKKAASTRRKKPNSSSSTFYSSLSPLPHSPPVAEPSTIVVSDDDTNDAIETGIVGLMAGLPPPSHPITVQFKEEDPSRPRKKKKVRAPRSPEPEPAPEPDVPPRQFTVYIFVSLAKPIMTAVRGSRAAPQPPPIQRSPFLYKSDASFHTFSAKLGGALVVKILFCCEISAHFVELIDLYERTGVRGIAFFLHGNADDPVLPHCVDSDNAMDFLRQVLGIAPLDLLLQFEQWSYTHDDEVETWQVITSISQSRGIPGG